MLAHFAHHLLTALPIPLLPMIRRDFALDYTQAGLVISAFTLAYGLSQLPAGWLADYIGRRIMITIGIAGVALAGLMVGLSQTYIMVMIFLVLMGFMGGGYHPAAPPMISESVQPERRGWALGLHMIGGSASYFLAPLMAAAIAVSWGWRGSFVTLAVPTLILGIVMYIILGRLTGARRAKHDKVSSENQAQPAPKHMRHLASFMTMSMLIHAITLSVVAFIAVFLVDHFGIGEGAAAAFIALVYSAGLWASPLGGYLSDRLGAVTMVLAAGFIAGPAIYLLGLIPFGVGIGVLMLIIGMTMYVRMPVAEAYIVKQTSERNRSAVLGINAFGGMEGAGVLTPVLGLIIDRYGFYAGFTIAGATVFLTTIIGYIMLRGHRG